MYRQPEIRLLFRSLGGTVSTQVSEQVLSFQLVNQSPESLKASEVEDFQQKIKSGNLPFFTWRLGSSAILYKAPEEGYKLKIYCADKENGKDLLQEILKIRDKTPRWDLVKFVHPDPRKQLFVARLKLISATLRFPGYSVPSQMLWNNNREA